MLVAQCCHPALVGIGRAKNGMEKHEGAKAM